VDASLKVKLVRVRGSLLYFNRARNKAEVVQVGNALRKIGMINLAEIL